MDGVNIKMVGSKLVIEIDILRAIADGIGGARPIGTVKPEGSKPGPKPKAPTITPGPKA